MSKPTKPEMQRKTTSRTKAPVAKEVPAAKRTVLKTTARTVAAKKPAAKSITKPATAPTHEEITRRAYEIYVARGMTPGNELEDWVQAERELLSVSHRNN